MQILISMKVHTCQSPQKSPGRSWLKPQRWCRADSPAASRAPTFWRNEVRRGTKPWLCPARWWDSSSSLAASLSSLQNMSWPLTWMPTRLYDDMQPLAKVFRPLELICIWSHHNLKLKSNQIRFFEPPQHKAVHDCEVEGKLFSILKALNILLKTVQSVIWKWKKYETTANKTAHQQMDN